MSFNNTLLKTERLILRPIAHKDSAQLFAIRKDPEVMRYIPRPLAVTIEDAHAMIDRMLKGIEDKISLNWTITLGDDDEFIGYIGYFRMNLENHRAEIGYITHPDYQGKGYTKEALKAATDYGFNEMGLHTIEAVTAPENTASQQLLLKSGFIKEAHFRENVFFENRYLDSVHYTLFKLD